MIWSDNLKVFLIQMFGHEIKTKSNFQRVRHQAWLPCEPEEIMTFEILITLYGLFLMIYMPYVLIKFIRMRREHDRQYREFMRRKNNA